MSIKKSLLLLLFCACITISKAQVQFIDEVLEYAPAPGQFINSSPWGTPHSTNSIVGTVNGSLSLGAFGGYVVFRFDDPVQNHPDNPFGVDFTIFGNPSLDWSEPGTVYVMKDENDNGLPDDIWYELAGSDYFFSSTKKDYEVQYFNPHSLVAADVPWTDNYGNSGKIPANFFNKQPYYPIIDSFPNINNDNYKLSGTLIEGKIDISNPINLKSFKRAFGYADNQYRGVAPYDVPDNPYTKEKENAGGDAFDIDWAVDENGNYVDLDCIHFVKVQTAMIQNVGDLGEISTEITGAAVVKPNKSITGILDLIVIKDLPDTITNSNFPLEAFLFHKGRLQPNENIVWTSSAPEITIIDNELVFGICGEVPVTLTATSENNHEVFTEINTIILKNCGGINSFEEKLIIYPNPAKDFIKIDVPEKATVIIYDNCGKLLLKQDNYLPNESLNISNFTNGLYFVKVIRQKNVYSSKLIINR